MTQRSVKVLFKSTVVFFGLLSMVRFVIRGATIRLKTGRLHISNQVNKQNFMCSMCLKNLNVRLTFELLNPVISDRQLLLFLLQLWSLLQDIFPFSPLSSRFMLSFLCMYLRSNFTPFLLQANFHFFSSWKFFFLVPFFVSFV